MWPAALLATGALLAAVGAVMLVLVETGVVSAEATVTVDSEPSATTTVAPATTVTPTTAGAEPTTYYTHPITDPARILIPAIEVDARIMRLGIRPSGDMRVPYYGRAGWYELGPAPGAAGPAVIVGHVDTTKEPDIFYRLDELQPGDEFYVWDDQGDSAVFVVDSSELVLKSELPRERIWVKTQEALIRLITCGGEWDSSSGHYKSNVIVYGHLLR